jgi:hypothetical protein
MADNPRFFAFIIDGEVAEVLQTDDKLAAIFLSQPKIVEFDREKNNVVAGMKYDGTKFSIPE